MRQRGGLKNHRADYESLLIFADQADGLAPCWHGLAIWAASRSPASMRGMTLSARSCGRWAEVNGVGYGPLGGHASRRPVYLCVMNYGDIFICISAIPESTFASTKQKTAGLGCGFADHTFTQRPHHHDPLPVHTSLPESALKVAEELRNAPPNGAFLFGRSKGTGV